MKISNNLHALAEECKSPNWDGHGAAPVSHQSYVATSKFLEVLPLGAVVPSGGIEPDGEITLEWYYSPRRTLSISFSKSGEIHFAALLGARKTYGTEPFHETVPKTILDLVAQVK